jgi:hypothetical protein
MPTTAIFLFALGLFFSSGVYAFLKQGIKTPAIIAGLFAVMSFVAAGLRL